ncbi:hypothetical protein BAXH7_00150 [Bacillus amyloliquefaciens XH7]|nr:hypothetical protein LL3_00147 [Bacillus amyloliquefaciens LL3]AEK87302.1 hypothetical protein BAXH7_00150 [Bacillus amyloliquefaciens XH7]KYC98200.1 hypothetical protein B425_0087 [Bacillus amyloliquefaciens]QBG54558.1 hypothetical protein D2M30_0177 [Bacillus amyloliquefaciens]
MLQLPFFALPIVCESTATVHSLPISTFLSHALLLCMANLFIITALLIVNE